jgi:predicted adenylyl cyclase CyaB
MIEIEKKFALTEEEAKRLLAGATFIKEVVMIDSYFDNAARTLSLKDCWLRERNGRFELKIASYKGEWKDQVVNQYRELETDTEIAEVLGLLIKTSLREALAAAGYAPFATIQTTRRKHSKEGFTIDMDVMDFGYTVSEIELMVEDESKMQEAVDKIMNFAKREGVIIKPVQGKLLEYLRRNDPPFFEKLVAAGAH